MKKVADNKLERIIGGEISLLAVLGISAIVVFVAGILEGVTSPKKCE